MLIDVNSNVYTIKKIHIFLNVEIWMDILNGDNVIATKGF